MSDGRPLLASLIEAVNKANAPYNQNLQGIQRRTMGTSNGKDKKCCDENVQTKEQLKSSNESETEVYASASYSEQSLEQNDESVVKKDVMDSDPCIIDMNVKTVNQDKSHNSLNFFSQFLGFANEKSDNKLCRDVKCFQRTSAPITPEKMNNISTFSTYNEVKELSLTAKRYFHIDSANNLPYEQPVKRVRHEEEQDAEGIVPSQEYVSPRQWEWTYLGSMIKNGKKKASGMEFTLMSYNVLSQDLLEDNLWLYPYCHRDILQWDWRKQHLLYQFKKFQPDVLCLQEVHKDHFKDFFEPELAVLGYRGKYQKRSGYKFDGCATFYKVDKFAEETANTVEYCRIGNSLGRENIALIMKLKPVSNGESSESVFVANTHILFNPRRGDIKLAQLIMLFAEIDKMSHKENVPTRATSYSPMIICGDFNSEPHSEIYKFITRGYIHYDGLNSCHLSGQREGRRGKNRPLSSSFFPSNLQISDQCQFTNLGFERNQKSKTDSLTTSRGLPFLPSPSTPIDDDGCSLGQDRVPYMSQQTGYLWHHLNLVSSYTHKIERFDRRKLEVTTHHQGADCTVDYIFYNVDHRDIVTKGNEIRTKNVSEGKLKLLGRFGLLSSDELRFRGSLPNAFDPSDHLPLLTKFLLSS